MTRRAHPIVNRVGTRLVMTLCPRMGKPVSTRTALDREAFGHAVGGTFWCAQCGREHRWARDEAWIEGDGPLLNRKES